MTYTDSDIANLFSCSKEVVTKPKGLKEERGNLRDSFTLKSPDGSYNFNCYIRKLTAFPENFSIGLDYIPKEEKGTIKLLRCNGKHGGTIEFPHHAECHIHKATAFAINNGLDHLSTIELTSEYTTLEEAIQYFIRFININPTDRKNYYPPATGQATLFGE